MNYIIISNFYRLNNKLIKEICNNDTDNIKMDLNNNSINEILEEAKYNSLFDSAKNIIVYNCNLFSSRKLEEDEQELLISYLSNPNPDNNLIFIEPSNIDNRKKIVKIIKEKGKLIDYSRIKYYDLQNLINDYIKSNGWSISTDIVSYLIQCCENNYDLICNELDKIIITYPDGCSLEDAKKIISTNISDNVFKFVDEVVKKDYKKTLDLLKDLKTNKIEPTIILNMIYREFRFIYLYKISLLEKLNIDNVFKNEGLADWQLNKISDEARKYSIDEINKAILMISDYDYKYKSGKIDRHNIIESFLLEFIN